MKRYYLLFLIILLIYLIIIPFVIASDIDYQLGVSKNDDFIWKVNKFDETTYNKYFSEKADFKQGDSKKYTITNIDEKSDKWVIDFDVWDYTTDEEHFTEDPDKKESLDVYKNPADQADQIIIIDDILELWVIPTPYSYYLEGLRDNFDDKIINIYVDDTGLDVKYAFSNIEYEIKITYTLDGVADTIKYIESNGNIFVEINLYRETIVSYLLFLPLIGIITLVYISFLKKKLL